MNSAETMGVWNRPLGSRSDQSGIVDGGRGNLMDGVRLEARRLVEAKYADELKEAGAYRRWQLQRQIEKEVVVQAAAMMAQVSDKSLF